LYAYTCAGLSSVPQFSVNFWLGAVAVDVGVVDSDGVPDGVATDVDFDPEWDRAAVVGAQPAKPIAAARAAATAANRRPACAPAVVIVFSTLSELIAPSGMSGRAFRIWTLERLRLGEMRLLLIRHGQTIDNVHGELGTVVPGPVLTELGQEQAASIPAALANEDITGIFASTMRRTVLTATPLAAARGLDITVLDGLQEISAGIFETKSDRDSVRAYMGTIISWWQDSSARIPGGESGDEFFARFTAAVAIAVEEQQGTIAIFSHGAAIRTWVSAISRNIDEAFSRVHELPNTAMIVLEGSPTDGWIAMHWDGEPVGGEQLDDPTAPDPTGEVSA
jgi:broad specificity phosphatase PhoE